MPEVTTTTPTSGTKVAGYSSSSRRYTNNNKNEQVTKNQNPNFKPTAKFLGRCEAVRDYVYDRSGTKQRQAEQHTKTTQELLNYAERNYKDGHRLKSTIIKGKRVEPPKPVKPKDADETEIEIWKEEIKDFVKDRKELTRNLQKFYALVWGQCSDDVQHDVESREDYEEIAEDNNVIKLLEILKGLAHNFVDQVYKVQSLHQAKRSFYLLHQGNDDVASYMKPFMSAYEVVREMGGRLGRDRLLIKMELEQLQLSLGTPNDKENKIGLKEATKDQKDGASNAGLERYTWRWRSS